jgi:hypothetical protein
MADHAEAPDLPTDGWSAKASSVLKRSTKLYGAKHVLDDKEDTCWNSDQGSPQWLEVEFPAAIHMASFTLTFQGGFVGQNCEIWVRRADGDAAPQPLEKLADFEPEDVNTPQTFECPADAITKVRLYFHKSTDFYGRVVVYRLRLGGTPAVDMISAAAGGAGSSGSASAGAGTSEGSTATFGAGDGTL